MAATGCESVTIPDTDSETEREMHDEGEPDICI
jgi:hypothetical protein